jgi:hypothetical protein
LVALFHEVKDFLLVMTKSQRKKELLQLKEKLKARRPTWITHLC